MPRLLEPDIHAGTKYLEDLMVLSFNDVAFTDDDRTLFAFASYNADSGTINSLRRGAERRELYSDRWFNNLELVVADKVGCETTAYVRNFYNYYAANKLRLEVWQHQRRALENFAQRI